MRFTSVHSFSAQRARPPNREYAQPMQMIKLAARRRLFDNICALRMRRLSESVHRALSASRDSVQLIGAAGTNRPRALENTQGLHNILANQHPHAAPHNISIPCASHVRNEPGGRYSHERRYTGTPMIHGGGDLAAQEWSPHLATAARNTRSDRPALPACIIATFCPVVHSGLGSLERNGETGEAERKGATEKSSTPSGSLP